MIRPITEESAWLATLDMAELWTPPMAPLVVVSPHPDDETLGCGGLIALHRAAGLAVTVIAVTDGEHAYADTEPAALAETRRGEQAAAVRQLGVDEGSLVRLGLTDSGLEAKESQLVEALLPHVTAGAIVVAPWTGDFHPDHVVCGRAAQTAVKRAGADLLWYFFWTWHRGTVDDLEGLALLQLALTSEARHAKASALAEHRSQLQRDGGEAILPVELLGPAYRPFEIFAKA